MRILILGAGAIGGYYGGRIQQGGGDVTFLVRAGRAAQLADGLRIESPEGDATLAVKTLQAGEVADPFDVILLANKAYGLDGALAAIAPHVRAGTVILPLLNGYAHMAAIEARFPEATVWGGVAQIPATLRADGVVQHLGQFQALIVGTRAGQAATQPMAEAILAQAAAGGVSTTLSEDIEQALWDKWIMLATLAAATCLMRGSVGEILETDHGETLLSDLLAETRAVAGAEGHPPSEAYSERIGKMVVKRGSPLTASMMRDMAAGGPTEAAHILGDMIARAGRHGIGVPCLATAYAHLQVYEAQRSG